MRLAMLLAAAVMVAAAAGCGSSGGGSTPENCASGKAWSGGNDGAPIMNPGQDCIACHATENEAPKFVIAGTVMGASKDDDNCNGLSGVKVEITDANGQVITLTTNEAGNFYAEEKDTTIALPYTAKITGPSGKTNQMSTAQSTGACNSCHTAKGANGAPGRITIPE
jgi:mono/diheme cytochrome c family protein